MENLLNELIFWGIWLLIPLIVDIFTSLVSAITILFSRRGEKDDIGEVLSFYPMVSVIVPVYNSEDSLERCIQSIIDQEDYEKNKIEIILIDNGSVDTSRDIFYKIQGKNPSAKLWYMSSEQGKTFALNKGIYSTRGKYILNIDSDGVMDKYAIRNLVYKFEKNPDIDAMTGVILTDFEQIKKQKGFTKRLISNCELFEYNESFLIGRAYEGKRNKLFTMAGAFSAFKKEIIMKTGLYNGETLGEDTHMTAQIRDQLGGKVVLCEDAYFFVDPIENLDKLYVQRQRWQRGEIEVSSLFYNDNKKKGNWVLTINMIKDHTMIFPRLIWAFAMFYLIFKGYPMKLIIGANLIMYAAYAFVSILNFFISKLYLKELPSLKKYMEKHFYIVFFIPLYRMITFLVRFIGTINAVDAENLWTTKGFIQEREELGGILYKHSGLYRKIKDWFKNKEN